MFSKLLLLFTIVPILELYILIKIGEEIGAFYTILIIIITAVTGAWLTKSQGLSVLRDLRSSINNGKIPAYEIMHGFIILLGGFALLAPGVITDLMGISMLIPFTRKFYIDWIIRVVRNKIRTGRWNFRIFN